MMANGAPYWHKVSKPRKQLHLAHNIMFSACGPCLKMGTRKSSPYVSSRAQEAAYLRAEGRASFERPYGLAWLLQLGAELREWEKEDKNSYARELSANLRPLEQAAADRLKTWLPKLSYPV